MASVARSLASVNCHAFLETLQNVFHGIGIIVERYVLFGLLDVCVDVIAD